MRRSKARLAALLLLALPASMFLSRGAIAAPGPDSHTQSAATPNCNVYLYAVPATHDATGRAIPGPKSSQVDHVDCFGSHGAQLASGAAQAAGLELGSDYNNWEYDASAGYVDWYGYSGPCTSTQNYEIGDLSQYGWGPSVISSSRSYTGSGCGRNDLSDLTNFSGGSYPNPPDWTQNCGYNVGNCYTDIVDAGHNDDANAEFWAQS
jgi:hypothetical protein